jgi:hypothetical protein
VDVRLPGAVGGGQHLPDRGQATPTSRRRGQLATKPPLPPVNATRANLDAGAGMAAAMPDRGQATDAHRRGQRPQRP